MEVKVYVLFDASQALLDVLSGILSVTSKGVVTPQSAVNVTVPETVDAPVPKTRKQKATDAAAVEPEIKTVPETPAKKSDVEPSEKMTLEELNAKVVAKRQENDAVNRAKIKELLNDFMCGSTKDLKEDEYGAFAKKLADI